jgi:outer membrane receptor protein involved in Fe transport
MNKVKLLISPLIAVSLIGLFALMWSVPVMAQSADTGALTGIIRDPSGAVIAGAEISVTNISTSQSRSAVTGTDGIYRFSLLPPGKYKVKASMAGFKTAEFPSITVNVTQTAVLDCTLEIGTPNETLTVEAGAEILQTATSTLGTLVSSQEVVSLPLTSRNYTQILDLSTGVSAAVHDATALGKGTQYTSVNGSNPSQNNYQMDGVAINSLASLGTAGDQNVGAGIGIPNPDAIQEFKIQTSTYDASYGRNPGANVNVVTKSGGNQLHGSAFEFLRNTVLNANPFFYNRDNPDSATKKPVLNQNQFGFVLGGPVKKDRFFLFGSYQGSRQKNGLSGKGSLSVNLPPIPGGDRNAAGFAAALGAASCGFMNWGWMGGANVKCDGSNISPVALNILKLKLPDGGYYIPGSGTADFKRVSYSDPARYVGDQFIVNSDFIVTPKQTLQTRLFITRDPQYASLGGMLPGNPQTDYYSNHNAVAKLTSFISNAFTNEARFSLQRNWGDITDDPLKGSSPKELGINHVVPDQNRPPEFLILNGPTLFNDFRPAQSLAQHYQLGDQIAWVRDRHTLRAGFEFERVHFFSNPGFSRGFLIIGTWNDFLVGGPGNIYFNMMEKGDGPEGSINHAYRMNNLSAFLQDDWKLSPRLTLNLGLRWEYDGMLSDSYGNLTSIWPSLIATLPVPPTGPTTSGPGLVGYVVPANTNTKYGPTPAGVLMVDNNNSIASHPPYSNFGPRVGIAWQPTSKGNLVVRAGFGLFYDRVWADAFVHAVQQSPPYAVSLDYSGPNPYTLQNPFRDLPLGTYPSRWSNLICQPDGTNCNGPGAVMTSNLNSTFLSQYIHTPLTRQYNLSMQYEFVRNWVLEVGYVGSSGINLMDVYHNKNIARLASPSHPINGQIANTLANVNLRVPYLGYQPTGLQGTEFDGTSNYNSLQATVRKQFSYGLALQGSYTWSKNLSDIATGGPYYSRNSNDPDDPAQQYGPTSYSRPQRFILNYRYELPRGNRQGVAGKFLNGWSLAGITTIQSGSPLTFTDTRAGTIYGNSGGITTGPRAQLCSGATHDSILTSGDIENRLGGSSGGPGYINAGAFCAPPTVGDGTGYGNSGVGIVLGPGQFNWDITIIKETQVREGHSIEFRTEFYNAFNTPQFANPATAVSTPATFGQITGTSVNPRIIQFGLKYSF